VGGGSDPYARTRMAACAPWVSCGGLSDASIQQMCRAVPCCAVLSRYQDRGLPFCYVGYFDGMEEGVLRANIIEAKVNNVSVRWGHKHQLNDPWCWVSLVEDVCPVVRGPNPL